MSNTKLKVIDNKELKFSITLDDVELLQSLSKTTKSEKQKIVQTIFELGLKIWKIQSVEVDYQKLDDQREKIVKSFESASKNAESNLSDLTDKLLKGKNGRLALAVDREAKNLEKQLGQLFESDNKKSVPSKIEKVVESTVIFLPIFQFGCFKIWFFFKLLNFSLGIFSNEPPEAVK